MCRPPFPAVSTWKQVRQATWTSVGMPLPNLDNRPPVLGLWECCCQIWKLQGTSVGRPVPNLELGRRIRPVGVLLPNLETRRCQIWKIGPRYWACGRAAAKYGNCRDSAAGSGLWECCCQIWKLGPRYWACGRAAAKYGNCSELLWEGRCQTWNSAAGSGLLECCYQIWKLAAAKFGNSAAKHGNYLAYTPEQVSHRLGSAISHPGILARYSTAVFGTYILPAASTISEVP